MMELYYRYSKVIRYGVIGAFSSSVDFVAYTLLVMTGVHLMSANVCGVIMGIFTSFLLNRRYNFKVTDRVVKRFLSFFAVGLIGLGLSSALLYVFVERLSVNEIVAKIVTIFVVAVFQFCLNSSITFKKK